MWVLSEEVRGSYTVAETAAKAEGSAPKVGCPWGPIAYEEARRRCRSYEQMVQRRDEAEPSSDEFKLLKDDKSQSTENDELEPM